MDEQQLEQIAQFSQITGAGPSTVRILTLLHRMGLARTNVINPGPNSPRISKLEFPRSSHTLLRRTRRTPPLRPRRQLRRTPSPPIHILNLRQQRKLRRKPLQLRLLTLRRTRTLCTLLTVVFAADFVFSAYILEYSERGGD